MLILHLNKFALLHQSAKLWIPFKIALVLIDLFKLKRLNSKVNISTYHNNVCYKNVYLDKNFEFSICYQQKPKQGTLNILGKYMILGNNSLGAYVML